MALLSDELIHIAKPLCAISYLLFTACTLELLLLRHLDCKGRRAALIIPPPPLSLLVLRMTGIVTIHTVGGDPGVTPFPSCIFVYSCISALNVGTSNPLLLK